MSGGERLEMEKGNRDIAYHTQGLVGQALVPKT